MIGSRSPRTEQLLLLAILLLAGGLRLGWPGLTEFKADEARLLTLALEMAQGRWAVRGIDSSVGFPNFPMSVWLYTLPVLLWAHPLAATLFTGLLNTAAVLVTYRLTRRFWGVHAALAASLMLAVSPWAVLFSRKIWAQNLLPLFVAGWGAAALLALVEGRHRWTWLLFLCLAVAVQLHLAAVALAPATAVLLLIFRRRVRWRLVAGGILLGLLTAAPFLVSVWPAWSDGGLAGLGAGGGRLDGQSLRLTATLAVGSDLPALAGPEAVADFLALAPPVAPVRWLWAGLILLGAFLLAGGSRPGPLRPARPARREPEPGAAQPVTAARRREAGAVILVWLLAPPLFFLWHNTPLFIHYFIAILPAPYIAAGVGFAWLAERRAAGGGQPRRWAAWTVLVATAGAQVWLWGALLAFVTRQATPGGFGVPLAAQLQAAAAARAQVAAGAAEVLVAGDGEDPAQAAFPAVYHALLHDVPHRFVDLTRSTLFPARPAVVLVANDPPAGAALYAATAAPGVLVPLRRGEGSLAVRPLPPAAAPSPDVPLAPAALLANWVHLLGHDAPRTLNGALAWQVHWRTADNPDPADYHFFNHLLDADGRRLAQADAAAFAPSQWRAGDVVVSHFRLDLPPGPGPWQIRTGMYRYPSLEPVLLLDVAGNPYDDAVTFPLPPLR